MIIWPHLTTIRQPVTDLAYAAADMLLSRALADEDAPNFSDTRQPCCRLNWFERDFRQIASEW